MHSTFMKTGEAAKYFGVSSKTLERWRQKGNIRAINPTGGCWYYSMQDLTCEKKNYIYARISSKDYQSNLEKQCAYLKTLYPSYELVTDVDSSLHNNRPGLDSILQAAHNKMVGKVVVAHKDILSRFSYELIEYIITKNEGEIINLNNAEYSSDYEIVSDVKVILAAAPPGHRKYLSESEVESLTNL